MIPAFDAVRAIHKCQGEAMVLPTVTEYRYWKAVSDREDLDITPPDSMGPASVSYTHLTLPTILLV